MGSKILYPFRFYRRKRFHRNQRTDLDGHREEMNRQIRQKLEDGFSCLKMKIGALNFDEELEILESLRKEYPADELEIRVDANGAFKPKTALEMIKMLSEFDLHSIEQPIPPGHPEAMAAFVKLLPYRLHWMKN